MTIDEWQHTKGVYLQHHAVIREDFKVKTCAHWAPE